MRHALSLHPDFICAAVSGIDVEVSRQGPGELALIYKVSGAMERVYWPPAAAVARVDNLWRRTCFEAFVGAGSDYLEFNFSPSGEWAAYRFAGYRTGMAVAEDIAAPRIETRSDEGSFELRVVLELPPDVAGPLGVTAVIEETGGNLSYWALAHPSGKPDFHHSAGFVLELPPLEPS
jgi:hypothetical protein